MAPTDKQRCVIVTGGAKRLGRIIAERLAADGYHVIIHYRGSEDDSHETKDNIRAKGQTADVLQADFADLDTIPAFMDAAHTIAGGSLFGLVNSASMFEYDDVASMTAEGLRQNLTINLEAPVLLAQAFAKTLGTAQGCVVNLLDQKLWNLNADFLSYTISKFGLLGATRTLAMALAPHIRVCAVAPGLNLPSGGQTEEQFREAAAKYNLLDRRIEPTNVADTVAFLLRNDSMTGNTIMVDNGQHLYPSADDTEFNSRNMK